MSNNLYTKPIPRKLPADVYYPTPRRHHSYLLHWQRTHGAYRAFVADNAHVFIPVYEIRGYSSRFYYADIIVNRPIFDKVPYDDAWSVLSNAGQLLPNIDFSHIKSGNVNILHLRMYLTIVVDREDDITIAHVFILFMMGYLWFQTANDTVPLKYLAAVADLDEVAQEDWGSAILASLYHGLDTAVTTGGAITEFSQLLEYWFYEYCGVGHQIVKEEVKFSAYPRLRAWEMGNKKKTNDQAANLFMLGRYHIDNRTIETITWEPWLKITASEIEDILTT
ncbi:hypothetical protein GIB67_038776 [Kingdonia uniflora]|uniref:Aminotransferase-like plant mobile domain-containing protein n=1 Tax=Kingdonia uniflora TaxID=39325 RepID=A0A7J7M0L5_9MAGN|nr:hypothetical protein GIB67_038776 [Kingdonia uniflora]